jgi:hypothetical protein
MDSDFTAKEALQPVLKVILSPDGEVIRALVIKEAVRVSEAFTLSSISDTYKSAPDFMRTLVFNGNANGPLVMSESEMQSMIELRNQVRRIWGLLQSSNDFDPALLLPIFQVRSTVFCIFILHIQYLWMQVTNVQHIIFLFFDLCFIDIFF